MPTHSFQPQTERCSRLYSEPPVVSFNTKLNPLSCHMHLPCFRVILSIVYGSTLTFWPSISIAICPSTQPMYKTMKTVFEKWSNTSRDSVFIAMPHSGMLELSMLEFLDRSLVQIESGYSPPTYPRSNNGWLQNQFYMFQVNHLPVYVNLGSCQLIDGNGNLHPQQSGYWLTWAGMSEIQTCDPETWHIRWYFY